MYIAMKIVDMLGSLERECPMCLGTGDWRGTGHCFTCDDSGQIK